MKYLLPCFLLLLSAQVQAQENSIDTPKVDTPVIYPADYNMDAYLPMLKGKKVALLMNHTAVIGRKLLIDTLLKRKVNVVKIFGPEHGFRGGADAGETIKNGIDDKTKLPVVSLYGNNKKPSAEQLKGIDVLVYDVQDVGVRFYTYIATLQYAMEACAENNVQLLILDRPDPNGFYVHGPVLDTSLRSFVGMQPIPIVYGMTCGEYAKMLVGERWFNNAEKLDLKIIPCKNYDHSRIYSPPVWPSPNLRNIAGILVYPTICLFEGTVVSVGRGTDMPFQLFGHPDFFGKFVYNFTPKSIPGALHPPYEDQVCYGPLVAMSESDALEVQDKRVRTYWLQRAYKHYQYKDKFFNNFFDNLAGNRILKEQIKNEMPEVEIHQSWEKDLKVFKAIRKKYLLYKDFE